MKQILLTKGQVLVEEVPAPVVDKGSVLVKVKYSLISTGTETMGIKSSGESIFQKALNRPEKLKQALNSIKTQGITATIDKVKTKLESPSPIGYSCSGVAIDIGKNIYDIKAGEHIACSGFGYANHAEFVCVPRNLVSKVPEGLDLKQSASVTLGAIAMQGIRRANPSFGETIAVIGLGLVGQITIQILKSAGCRVIGMDISRSRVELARNLGIHYGVISGEQDFVNTVMQYTQGHGADATIITAATDSDLPVQQAMEATRKKGKVVVVGAVGMNLKQRPFYEKEIDFLISCSYGPGRYDEVYEEKGIDYPYAYVRWTENRNMQEYLMMLAEGKVNFSALISREYNIVDAPQAYKELTEGENKPLAVILKYDEKDESAYESRIERKIAVNPKTIKKDGRINVAVIGAGGFAQSIHLPNLKKLSNLYNIYAIVTKTGSNAKQIAKRFGAVYCSTDYHEVLEDENIDMVLIATRHNLHAKMAMESAKAGKAIFLEKPMAINQQELDELVKVLEETQVPFMVGFNRRFSPFAIRAKEIILKRQNPLIINYRVNGGYIPLDNWIHTEEGGGRIIGEACHMFDLFNYFTDSECKDVQVSFIDPKTDDISSHDNFNATLKYSNGSICNLTYTALGSNKLGKEYIEIYSDGKSLVIDDFKSLRIYPSKLNLLRARTIDKGHLEEIKAFSLNIKSSNQPAIPIGQLVSATQISFIVDHKIRG